MLPAHSVFSLLTVVRLFYDMISASKRILPQSLLYYCCALCAPKFPKECAMAHSRTEARLLQQTTFPTPNALYVHCVNASISVNLRMSFSGREPPSSYMRSPSPVPKRTLLPSLYSSISKVYPMLDNTACSLVSP